MGCVTEQEMLSCLPTYGVWRQEGAEQHLPPQSLHYWHSGVIIPFQTFR